MPLPRRPRRPSEGADGDDFRNQTDIGEPHGLLRLLRRGCAKEQLRLSGAKPREVLRPRVGQHGSRTLLQHADNPLIRADNLRHRRNGNTVLRA
ncbi:hypothetical protein SDC9_121661 [bioreactor metagenome]|uniref:Uncharacterized protein n=1 Tax=bioreactor metagenome TaxID=1076179 RepID=A0A645CCR7_9ZZZZ